LPGPDKQRKKESAKIHDVVPQRARNVIGRHFPLTPKLFTCVEHLQPIQGDARSILNETAGHLHPK
jgi:hypothetical protein